MNDSKNTQSKIDKKLLENPFVGSLVVPIAIVLVGALIVFGVTKMISSEHSYKDLVTEMKSKTFGNKWVAALELSKLISAKKIPAEDIPWLVQSMDEIYSSSIDPRTRNFIVVAAGALNDDGALRIFQKGLKDVDHDVRFHTVVALANAPKGLVFDWKPVIEFLDSEDHGMVQTAIFALSTHQVSGIEKKIENLLNTDLGAGVRYTAATALIAYKNEKCLPIIEEILSLNETSLDGKMTVDQIRGLKFNVFEAIQRAPWSALAASIEKLVQSDKDVKVIGRGKEVLKLLKK
ncbi:HEAT repeat domain-containing protein [Bacteriovorax sp. Seq25_V]|uniref:HEAT repeat domain-containing protein n=1 Tax=Bacteriovorax sp. Seq25_V TaxID=1201288 RepID=UPI000389F7AA|nr:hypothetical protein [Bacteriovorax sp. Seq25_V]EQC43436.1 hypothetical protein M900_0269 [Bacteriovorax sp. Seq25_V]